MSRCLPADCDSEGTKSQGITWFPDELTAEGVLAVVPARPVNGRSDSRLSHQVTRLPLLSSVAADRPALQILFVGKLHGLCAEKLLYQRPSRPSEPASLFKRRSAECSSISRKPSSMARKFSGRGHHCGEPMAESMEYRRRPNLCHHVDSINSTSQLPLRSWAATKCLATDFFAIKALE